MVGRKTSERCENCRRRKLKCDLTKPSCFQCLRSKLKCQGYNTHARFHAVNPIRVKTKNQVPTPQAGLLSSTDVLRIEYVSKLSNGHLAARSWLMKGQRERNVQALELIPQRLGESRALDDAVKCVCSSLPLVAEGDTTRRSYSNALRSLQDALDDNVESMATGTLAAATILYFHEIYSNPFQQGWMIHAEGLIRLLEFRGPERIQTDLDRSILCGQVGTIFMNAVVRRKRCFLANEDWNCLLRWLTMSNDAANRSENEAPSILALSVHVPGLVCRFEELAANNYSPVTWSLIQDIIRIRSQLCRWSDENERKFGRSDFEAECFHASAAPMESALRMAAILFLVMTGYMLLELLCRHKFVGSTLESEELGIIAPKAADLIEECSRFAPIAKTKWLALRQTGREEAWASATPNVIMLRRVLKVPCIACNTVNKLRPVIQNLYGCLNDGDEP